MTMLDTVTMPARLRPVVFDLYRDIHKGIRAELFALVGDAGRLDPADDVGAAALAGQVRATVDLLEQHARHEDNHIGVVLDEHLPALAERIVTDHHAFETRTAGLVQLADDVAVTSSRRPLLHELYIELAAFTGTYLLHQDVEEREIAPQLEAAIGVEAVIGINTAIVSTMPPQELVGALAVMFPAMNIDDRTELLGGMRASAPSDSFDAVWSLAGSVLPPADHRAIGQRLGLV